MEPIYVDTSAFYALLDRDDTYHEPAKALWPELLENHIRLQTSNYVVSETVTLLQYRLGFEAASIWARDILAVLHVHWADQTTHRQAHELWMSLGRRRISLVDCVSYITMHKNQIEKAFCFKLSYTEQGFQVMPTAATNPRHLHPTSQPHYLKI